MKQAIKWFSRHLELLFFILALVVLYFMKVDANAPSLCFFKWLGLSHCPGCGIGHSMRYALHGEFKKSFLHHPFGILAIIIILYRIIQLLTQKKLYEAKNH
ncbi:DUF2752 domain-containing protein [Parasediminibacterium sp. JCM 36343]|uniref:DUF2752 domain-containing protein n=1 Tax=Parasediminibacterium sp. JCM 36343 TaxID=3374279 RepID=UPI0039797F43